jgi:hypothetical protein
MMARRSVVVATAFDVLDVHRDEAAMIFLAQ